MKCVFCIAINTKLIQHINNVDSDGERKGANVRGKQCVRQPFEVKRFYPWNSAHKQAAMKRFSGNGGCAVDALMTVHRRRIIQMW
jgi:hypothetical protein